MLYTIENDKIKVTISDLGAELQSIYGKKSGFEYLWQANQEGKWKGRATVIFPNCGRLPDGKYTYDGKTYELPCHGFAKLMTFNVIEQSSDKIVFELTESDASKKVYPFNFSLKLTYSLDGATVRTAFDVKNTGNPDLPFSVGGHPGFSLPFEKDLDFSDHYIEFDKAMKRTALDIAPSCLCAGTESNYELENDKIIRLTHELFKNDAIFLSAKADQITLKSNKSNKFVKISYEDMTHVGLWQTLGSDTNFVCIEPWRGMPAIDGKEEDFATKKEFIHLKDGESYHNYFDITVSE